VAAAAKDVYSQRSGGRAVGGKGGKGAAAGAAAGGAAGGPAEGGKIPWRFWAKS